MNQNITNNQYCCNVEYHMAVRTCAWVSQSHETSHLSPNFVLSPTCIYCNQLILNFNVTSQHISLTPVFFH